MGTIESSGIATARATSDGRVAIVKRFGSLYAMTHIAQVQLINSRYGSQVAEQLKRIEISVETGRDVVIRLVDGELETTLTFKGGTVFECSAVTTRPPGDKPLSLADNDSLVAQARGSYAFDLRQAEREVPRPSPPQAPSATPLRVDDDEVAARLTAGLPLTHISQMGGDEYFLVADCTYRANDGTTLTVLKGFRTDLASIPRLLTLFVTVRDLSITAPTFHDLLYRSGGRVEPPLGTVSPEGRVFTQEDADNLFLELMTREKIGFFKRSLAFGAVRLAGRWAWQGR